jgi:splicing factor 3A subunit 3
MPIHPPHQQHKSHQQQRTQAQLSYKPITKDQLTSQDNQHISYLQKACSLLEEQRCHESEFEASASFSRSLLSNPTGTIRNDAANGLPTGVQDAWLALTETCRPEGTEGGGGGGSSNDKNEESMGVSAGILGKAGRTMALGFSLKRVQEVAQTMVDKESEVTDACLNSLSSFQSGAQASRQHEEVTPSWLMHAFDAKVKEIREYHARFGDVLSANTNSTNAANAKTLTNEVGMAYETADPAKALELIFANPNKKRRVGHPAADGYDLHSFLHTHLDPLPADQVFSTEEVFGKYLDLHAIHAVVMGNTVFHEKKNGNEAEEKSEPVSYVDWLHQLSKGLHTLPEQVKLDQRKKYHRVLAQLQTYLIGFLNRTSPLLNVETEVIQMAQKEFDEVWASMGGSIGWTSKPGEKALISQKKGDSEEGESPKDGIDLQLYATAEELMEKQSPEQIKVELSRLGMKCGGLPLDRAKRLWKTKDTPLDKLPPKLFKVKPTVAKVKGDNGKNSTLASLQRIDLARLEGIVTALLDQLRPTLDATARRAERRLTQTRNEKEKEMEEEVYGGGLSSSLPSRVDTAETQENGGGDESDESDEEDAPIYNPKGVPLGWDGKPIPYWLFKLHGLNHFYPCEICGNESYRGRRNFEKHFTEAKHSYGMKCLGIPNTKHFHGVTKIEDAQKLWAKLQSTVNKDIFDGAKEEEYEDSHGNILSRATYEDLARQGLL